MSRQARKPRALPVVLVSIYLFAVGVWLIATRRIPSPPLGRLLLAPFRRRYRGVLASFRPESGHCFLAAVPASVLSDKESVSRLVVLEDGCELPHGHAAHDDIRRLGAGRYSHWGEQVYLSTSDNSDPRTNGRRYEVVEH